MSAAWTYERGDKWYRDDAEGDFSFQTNSFTIESFGSYCSSERALNIIRATQLQFQDGTVYVYLDELNRKLIEELSAKSILSFQTVELSPSMQVARIEECYNSE